MISSYRHLIFKWISFARYLPRKFEHFDVSLTACVLSVPTIETILYNFFKHYIVNNKFYLFKRATQKTDLLVFTRQYFCLQACWDTKPFLWKKVIYSERWLPLSLLYFYWALERVLQPHLSARADNRFRFKNCLYKSNENELNTKQTDKRQTHFGLNYKIAFYSPTEELGVVCFPLST